MPNRLALRTEVRRASAHDDSANPRATVVARFVGATEDSDEVLLFALGAVDIGVVAERSAAVADAILEHLPDGDMQQPSLGGTQ